MAIGTLAQLQAAVAKWLERVGDSDLSASADDLVALAEARLNRELAGLRIIIVDGALTGTIGSRQLALPSNYYAPVALFLTTYSVQTKLRQIVIGGDGLRTSNGTPTAWGINGENIDLDCPCDAAHTFQFRYQKGLALASDAGNTNWLLQKYPDIYLNATLAQGALMFGDADAVGGYEALLERGLSEVRRKEAAAIGMAPLQIAPEFTLGGAGRGFDINAGE